MATKPPKKPKIVHIVHVDRLTSIASDGFLWSDAEANSRQVAGTTIGMSEIKRRRLEENMVSSHPGLMVGQCVPFYFWPRSVMLFLISRQNHPNLAYQGGQDPIVHLVADLSAAVAWADDNEKRWALTSGNAGSKYFDDWADVDSLSKLNWRAIRAKDWRDPAVKEAKQAEFLVEHRFPWRLVERIGVRTESTYRTAQRLLSEAPHKPKIQIESNWYY